MPREPEPKARILIIEDSEATSQLITLSLSRQGYDVTVCPDGLTGLETALDGSFDLLLLDIALPGMFGWEVLRRIRASEDGKALPVIVLTAHHDTSLSDDSGPLAETVERIMSKPFDLSDLARTVADVLENR